MKSSATFSADRHFRYSLTRVWDESLPLVAFCMLNPSTADENTNDPTIERCQRRARMMGFGGLIVVNLFAYRATDPYELYWAGDDSPVIGPSNNDAIVDAANRARMFVCGWGKHGSLYGRSQFVMNMLLKNGVEPYALKLNKDGSPAHPLYIDYKVKPQMMSLMVKK